ncbi:hypothetical protein [Sporisorium scitamineum]|uniref:Uncharacterized protein n=1 Tax=Sporisorium scitamineum TaxID=49012 RepID=A0A0F7S6F2_9BASI|nr:hypothetical protein [Sporisorium scitamineum]
MAAVPVQVTEDVYLQDSLFERTASWIKSTMNEREPVAVEPSIFDQDEVDELTVANHVQSETAAATEPSEPHESFSIPEPSLAHNQDNLPARARFPGDQLTARTQLNVSAADPEAADCSIAAAIQRYESAPDGPNPSHDLSTKPVIGKISRSYSQRDGQGQHTVKGTRRIPGRLKIPQRQPESSATPRRDSLELLSMRRPQLSSAKDKGPSPKPVTERSYQGIGSTRADNFDDILRSWSRNNGQDPSQATPLSLGKNRVAGLVKNWDDGGGSSDDDEVAAVSTCQRMTLRRMPLMRVRPGLESDQAITTAAPVRRTIPQSQRQEEQSQRASSPPRRRPGYLASHTTISQRAQAAPTIRMQTTRSVKQPARAPSMRRGDRRADFRLPAGHSGTRQYSTTHERGSGIKNPSFEISFELTEPKLAPHVQEGTLMEFGLRVLIKPNGAEESDSSWRLKPPSQSDMGRRSATSQRSSASIHPMQYEYNRLSNHDMIKVQQEAQEHLSRTLASPDQRKRRLHLQESYLLSPFSDPCELDRSSSLTDAGSPSSAKRALRREIKLTRERDLSPSTAPSSVVSIRKSASMGRTPSASLVSPLPYIKRAPPRTATYSSVTTQS